MSNKIFLSFLGTNNYKECVYEFTGEDLKIQTEFTQIAIIKKHKNEINKYLFFLTKDAKEKNWSGENKLLSKILSENIDKCLIHEIDIPNGFNTQELLDIFDKLVNNVDQNSQLIIDVTHSFRSLPLNLSSVINYLKVTKNVYVEKIYYGAFEVLGNPRDVENIPVENRIVKMLDITYLDAINEWTLAIYNFLEYGRAEKLKHLSEKDIKPILSETKGKDITASTIRNVTKELSEFMDAIYTCRSKDILDFLKTKLLKMLSEIDKIINPNENYLIPQLYIPFQKLKNQINKLNENNHYFAFLKIVEWCLRYNWIQQGYTILNEGLLSYFMAICNEDEIAIESNNNSREIFSKTIRIAENNIPEHEWIVKNDDEKEKIKSIICKINNSPILANLVKEKIFSEISDIRNDINHAGFRNNSMSSKNISNKLRELYLKVMKLLETKN
ncbi:MAG: hypothetical protein KatS3mg027_1997 [Bacteroidia bacterium]|nr:MAG: hypothetical protein KatS3mg027_1997 [Bacteroidia bacterium]